MIRFGLVVLLALATAAPGLAAAQTGAQSIDDLLRRAAPPGELKVTAPEIAPDGPPTAEDQAYERRVLEAFRTAQNRQGALDGRWQIQALDGRVLYYFVFSDPNAGEGRVEGAWANPRRSGVSASGYVEGVAREGADYVITFRDGEAATRVRLAANGAGAWRGETQSGNTRTPVVMTRPEGIETMAFGQ